MRTEIRIDPSLTEPRLVLETPALTPAQQAMLASAAEREDTLLPGFSGDTVTRLRPTEILRFYTSGQRVMAETDTDTYTVRFRIYELEQRLDPAEFVRISQGEIVNLRRTEQFDLSLSGTIRVRLSNGAVTWVSRRYVKKIKQALGL